MASTARLPPLSACPSSSYPTSDDDDDDDVAPTFVTSLSSFGQASRKGCPFVRLLFIIWPSIEQPNQIQNQRPNRWKSLTRMMMTLMVMAAVCLFWKTRPVLQKPGASDSGNQWPDRSKLRRYLTWSLVSIIVHNQHYMVSQKNLQTEYCCSPKFPKVQ